MARNVPYRTERLATLPGAYGRQPLSLLHDRELRPERLVQPDQAWRGVRIGWLGDYGGTLATEPGVLALCERALKDFESLGCRVEPLALGFDSEALWRCFNVLRSLPISARFAPYRQDPQKWALLKPEAQWEYEQGVGLSALQIQQAVSVRSAWFQRVLALFAQVDFLALPSAQVFPFHTVTRLRVSSTHLILSTQLRCLKLISCYILLNSTRYAYEITSVNRLKYL